MRAVEERADQGDPSAQIAFEVYVHRLRSSIAAMAASIADWTL
jgi:acetate kinase